MADRMTLIMELGAMAKQAEKRGDNPGAATLRATLELLVHDQPIIAAHDLRMAEEARRTDERREADKLRKRRDRGQGSPRDSSGHDGIRRTAAESAGIPQGFPGPLPNSVTTTATSSSPAHAWETEAERTLAESLPTNVGRSALALVLLVVAKNAGMRIGVTGEIEACMSGHRGAPYKATAAQLDVALSDYATNGLSSGRWNADHFRACIRRAVANDQPATGPTIAISPRSATREHWTEKKEREDRASAEQRRVQGLVEARRARTLDGDIWWDRMRAAAGTPDLRAVYHFAVDHIDEPGKLEARAS